MVAPIIWQGLDRLQAEKVEYKIQELTHSRLLALLLIQQVTSTTCCTSVKLCPLGHIISLPICEIFSMMAFRAWFFLQASL